MNLKNTIVILIIFTLGVIIGFGTNYITAKSVIKENQKIMIEAVNKNSSEIINQFDKIKTGKGTSAIDLVSSSVTDTVEKAAKKKEKKRFNWFRKRR